MVNRTWFLAAATWLAVDLHGQDRPMPTAAACQVMLSSLQQAPLPQPTDSAWYLFPLCPGGATAFAMAIGLSASSTDTALLGRIVYGGRIFRDSALFSAYRSLALNASATAAARGAGFYGLITARFAGAELRQPITTVVPTGAACERTIGYPDPLVGTPLPAEYIERIASTARTVFNNTGNAAGVKAAARCAYTFVAGSAKPDVNTSKLVLTYVCGNTFQINNTNADPADVSFIVDGSPEHGLWHVPAKRVTKYGTVATGTVRLYYNGVQFTNKPNGGTTCQ